MVDDASAQKIFELLDPVSELVELTHHFDAEPRQVRFRGEPVQIGLRGEPAQLTSQVALIDFRSLQPVEPPIHMALQLEEGHRLTREAHHSIVAHATTMPSDNGLEMGGSRAIQCD